MSLAAIDYKKAFDHIDHSLILSKLKRLGVHECLINWIHNFLCDREMQVVIDGNYSDRLSPNGGVPQGTKLGPLLFIILINDLAPLSPTTKFVDDTTLHESFTSPANSVLQHSADQIIQWSVENKMALNATKTKEMLCCFRRKPDNIPHILIDGVEIERVEQAKLLGVIFSANLTWHTHVDYICFQSWSKIILAILFKTLWSRT